MTVQLVVCRSIATVQIERFSEEDRTLYTEAMFYPRSYQMIETLTSGWQQGARTRQKRFRNVTSLFQYLNKLNIHGWMSDDSYNDAWCRVLELQKSFKYNDSLQSLDC